MTPSQLILDLLTFHVPIIKRYVPQCRLSYGIELCQYFKVL
jgi:hypothetical protein